MTDLKPSTCPWCAEPANVQWWHGGGPDKRMISCDNDECAVRPEVSGETLAIAIAAWNTRAAPFGWTEDELRAVRYAIGDRSPDLTTPDWPTLSADCITALAKIRKGAG